MLARAARLARLLGFFLALASYWAPWVASQAAGLTIAEVDFPEFPKFMPQVRTGDLTVWRQSFYIPLLVLGVALVAWAARPGAAHARPGQRWAAIDWRRWLLRGVALLLPVTPSIFNVFESGEFQTQLTLAALLVVLIAFTPLLRRLPTILRSVALSAAYAFGALAPALQFFVMKPALDDIYHRPVSIGWGVWADVFGFALLAAAEWINFKESS